jgi:hypothetical protein
MPRLGAENGASMSHQIPGGQHRENPRLRHRARTRHWVNPSAKRIVHG